MSMPNLNIKWMAALGRRADFTHKMCGINECIIVPQKWSTALIQQSSWQQCFK